MIWDLKKSHLSFLLCLLLGSFVFLPRAWGDDMRIIQVETREIEDAMKQKAAQELQAARQAETQSRARILEDRAAMDTAIAELKGKVQGLKKELDTLAAEHEQMTARDADLTHRIEQALGTVRELSGVIRMNAKDISTLVDTSFLAGVFQQDTEFLKSISGQTVFPGMTHIRNMVDLLFEQIRRTGEVCMEPSSLVDRTGKTVQGQVLLIGGFTAIYRLPGETGFLNFTPGERKLYALSRLPSARMQKKIEAYMDGERDAVPMDISRGGALRQLTHELSLWEQIPKGGPIVWPILAILGVASLIALERIFFLWRRKIRLEPVISRIETSADQGNWQECDHTCSRYLKNPVIRVVATGLNNRKLAREELENAVQESILKEIPPMERFLSTMGMLAAIAPLLGLLGTVTGMIDTFHVITMHGTGDPRLMSGGISEALVTTMLGLSVAIPIMLAHTLLSRTVENIIGQMEEKGVALINIIQKHQGA